MKNKPDDIKQWAWDKAQEITNKLENTPIIVENIYTKQGDYETHFLNLDELIARALMDVKYKNFTYSEGTCLKKIKGSEWQGKVVGFYSTELTPEGYVIESESHSGSSQIYPLNALERVK